MKHLIGSILCAVVLFGLSQTAFAAESFDRNLSFGMHDVDVYRLQMLLNQEKQTRVADSGPGSGGSETDFFGNLTLTAVKKLQTIHADEILVPVGLTEATGFVGPSTRKFLNTLNIAQSATNTTTAAQTTTNDQAPNTTQPTVSQNTQEPVVNDNSNTQNTATNNDYMTNPATNSGLSSGTTNSSFLNLATTTPSAINNLLESLYQATSSLPQIVSISPIEVKVGDIVTITGTNFSSLNTVITSTDTYENIPSTDGTTLSFVFDSDFFTPFGSVSAEVIGSADQADAAAEGTSISIPNFSTLPDTMTIMVAISNEKGTGGYKLMTIRLK